MENYTSLQNCQRLYAHSGWLTDRVWLRSKSGWSVELASDYIKNPNAWLEWGAPAYTKIDLISQLAKQGETKDIPIVTDDICNHAEQLFMTAKLVASKDG
jgi:hypothetical protein